MRAFWNKRKYLIGQIALCWSAAIVPFIGRLPADAPLIAIMAFWFGLMVMLLSMTLSRAAYAARADVRLYREMSRLQAEFNGDILAEARQIIAEREIAKIAAQNALAKS